MDSKIQLNLKQNLNKFSEMNDSLSPPSNNSFKQKPDFNSPKNSYEITSTDTDSYIFLNNLNYEKSKFAENCIIVKNQDRFVKVLFKAQGENNALCNFSIFEKNIDINMEIDKKTLKKLTLSEYFDCFIQASSSCLNIPFLDKKGNMNYNNFNPTLSSIHLIVKNKKIKKENINNTNLSDFDIQFLSDEIIRIDFDEENPPYNRDIIGEKINNIHKILGQKKILMDNVVKENSYFSILWTPVDTHAIKSSFLSFYNFDFKLIGTLAIKNDDFFWFTTFVYDINNYKDFKKDYLNNINSIEKFIKKCNNINDEDRIDYSLFSHDYKYFIYNY